MGLGDTVERALAKVGVTEERVLRWFGARCRGCKRRQAMLNQLGVWAERVLTGRTEDAVEHLEGIIGPDEPDKDNQPGS